MVIFPLAPDQIIAQMWSNGARGGGGGFHLAGLLIFNVINLFVVLLHAGSDPIVAGAVEH